MIIRENLSDGHWLSISQSCQALEVSRSGYYKWMTGPASISSEDMDLKNEIQRIALEFPGYGYRRIAAELRNCGYVVNRKLVLKLMKQDNLSVPEEEIQDGDNRFQSWPACIPKPIEKRQDNWAESGLGVRYHIHPVAA
jgi:hypothetical protein